MGERTGWRQLLCHLGIHKWAYESPPPSADRQCVRCGKRELANYDMMYGETYYTKD